MSGLRKRLAVGVGVLIAAGVVSAVVLLSRKRPSDAEASGHFRDVAEESGLTFRMRFLTGEQGETFKINLYDHGSGVAVADYDGDGHDDIYLVNQLGPNALYRNRGDGTFE